MIFKGSLPGRDRGGRWSSGGGLKATGRSSDPGGRGGGLFLGRTAAAGAAPLLVLLDFLLPALLVPESHVLELLLGLLGQAAPTFGQLFADPFEVVRPELVHDVSVLPAAEVDVAVEESLRFPVPLVLKRTAPTSRKSISYEQLLKTVVVL